MRFHLFDVKEVAEYLHLTPADIQERIKNREIPFEKRGGRIVFRKEEIEEWASCRVLRLPEQPLAAYHRTSTRQTEKILPEEAIFPQLLEAGAVAVSMTSKTSSSVLSDLVRLADGTGHVFIPAVLLESLKSREQLSSTALPEGFALPHPRLHESYMFETSFIVVGKTVQEIYFGAPGGVPTRLFFLVCCQDERLHLHALARLCLVAKKTTVIEQLLEAADSRAMKDSLNAAEREVLGRNQN